MKLKNIFIAFITIFVLLLSTKVSAGSTAPDSYMVNGKDIYKMDSSKYLPNGGFEDWPFHYKKNANGDIIYCVESHDAAVKSGTMKYTLSRELEAKYAYVLANGYPNKSITGNNEKDYFITGLAVFRLVNPNDRIFDSFDFGKGTFKGSASDVAVEIAKLVNGANSYSHTNPSIKLNTNNNFTLSSDKKYYVSSNMNVSTTGIVGNYTISLDGAPSGTVVADVNGTVKNTFGVGESFVVMIPVSSINSLSNEFKVNVTASGTINKAYLYEAADKKYQNTAILYPVNNTISNSNNVKLELTTKVEISKIDVTTSGELPGATLTIKNSSGEVVKTWVSSNKPMIIENLPIGKYTLTEEIAPEGYVLSTETVSFEVRLDGTVTKVKMENKPEEKHPIYISKQDITTKEELPGAHLELRDENGNLVEAWVSTDTPHMIEKLDSGKYFLTEILAPEGYELSTETVEFIVNEDGTVDGEIIMYNEVQTVEVPNTASFKNITTSIIGIIVIALGAMMIYKNYKKNEEY